MPRSSSLLSNSKSGSAYLYEPDPTENIRREDQARLNAEAAERAELVKQYGIVWSTDELREAFEVLGFMAPYVVVRSKYTGKKGRCMLRDLDRNTSAPL